MNTNLQEGVDFGAWMDRLAGLGTCLRKGRLESVMGNSLLASLPGARLGERVHFEGGHGWGEVVGFDGERVRLAPAGRVQGLRPGLGLHCSGASFRVPFGEDLQGRIIDAQARPMDEAGPWHVQSMLELHGLTPDPLARQAVVRPMPTGVRCLDALVSLAEGQRLGLFAGPGLGKSSLLGQLARGCQADRLVIALVGERGREIGDFLRDELGPDGLARTVVVAAPADVPAADRARVVPMATAIAEGFRDRGHRVLLLVDSLTRHARALRELALGAGELMGRGGYPPSVFESLATLVERAGCGSQGSITAIYTVLTEGDLEADPLAEELRGLLDGHWVLSRELAARGCFPALDPLRSLSRLMDRVITPEHAKAAGRIKSLFGAYWDRRDLIAAGAYEQGTEVETDHAMAIWPQILAFFQQAKETKVSWEESLNALEALLEREWK